ncbi:LysR family transcriptional regulator [Shewanella maritima]|uniref:LysR family transcriptional regulator n=1 Tax=Shewanella maritima TaxID=2520507 RepID=UPI001A91A45D|nr:LysR family transcriptional regulator [Shewanella maritima]
MIFSCSDHEISTMNLSQIEAFCAVVDTGSVSAAARKLECNRTKLSMAIKALEKDLGTALFVRAGNNVVVSEAGKAIYKDCEYLLITSGRIRQICSQVNGEFASEIWIAHDDSLPDELWQELTLKLDKTYPATSFNVVLASSGDLADLVERGQVDYAFGVDFEAIDEPSMTYQPLGKIRMMSVCSSDHQLAKFPRVSDQMLREQMQVLLTYLNEKDNPELQPFSLKYIGYSSFEFMLKTISGGRAWGCYLSHLSVNCSESNLYM